MSELNEDPNEGIGRWLRNLALSTAALLLGYRYFLFAAIETKRADYGSGAAITQICLFWVLLGIAGRALTSRLPAWLRIEKRDLLFLFIFLFIAGPLMLGVVTFIKGTTSFYYLAKHNDVAKALVEVNLPRLAPSDAALESLYKGSQTGAIEWKPWFETAPGAAESPAVAWGVYLLFCLSVFFGLGMVFARRWLDKEQLAFPMARVGELLVDGYKSPTTGERLPLLGTRVFWFGVAATFIFQISTYFNPGLEARLGSFNFPDTTPIIGVLDYSSRLFWWRPVFLALLILCPRQILGSALFFHAALALFMIVGAGLGYRGFTGSDLPGASVFPFKEDQLIGGAVALTLLMAWQSRHELIAQFRAVFRAVRRRANPPGEPGAAGMILLLLSVAGFVLWTRHIGFAPRTIVFFLTCLMLGAVVNARGRAESGMPLIVVFSSFNPISVVSILGTKLVGLTTLAASALHGWLFWNNAGQIMPSLMDSLKTGRLMGRSIRWTLSVAAAAVVIGLASAAVMVFGSAYEHGLNHWAYQYGSGQHVMNPVFQLMKRETGVNGLHAAFSLAGGSMVALLWLGRTLFPGFLLHHMGYLLSLHSGLHHFSLALIVAYTTKTLCIRYGGMKTYYGVVPLFIGLLCGQMLGSLAGGALNAMLGTSVYLPCE